MSANWSREFPRFKPFLVQWINNVLLDDEDAATSLQLRLRQRIYATASYPTRLRTSIGEDRSSKRLMASWPSTFTFLRRMTLTFKTSARTGLSMSGSFVTG